jgi:hypothetical protein
MSGTAARRRAFTTHDSVQSAQVGEHAEAAQGRVNWQDEISENAAVCAR